MNVTNVNVATVVPGFVLRSSEQFRERVLASRERTLQLPLAVRWMVFLVTWAVLTTAGNCLLAAFLLPSRH